jgi:F-type H+-transporting ATPase subunit delta
MKIKKRQKRDAKELLRYCLVEGLLDESRVRSVAQHVAAGGRSEGPAVLSHFKRLVKLELIRRTATIESAAPLPADLQAAVEAGLKRRYGVGLRTTFAVRPALIGGMRIQVASDVYDGSVRTELAALENSF